MKHYMDIVRIREEDTEFYTSNVEGFKVGDHVIIQEKVDGANASIRYDRERKELVAFSRKNELTFDKTLNGFWNYVQSLPVDEYADTENYVIFGEWLLKNAIKYQKDAYNKWYVYDIFDTETGCYLPQADVKEFCKKHNLIYIKTFYDGPFISWNHCRSFVGKSDIALGQGEGVVIKNQTRLNSTDDHLPFVLKLVGDHFAEIKKANHREKVLDPMKLEEKARAQEIVDQIVTHRRVEKELFKMRDEGILPNKLTPQDMSLVARNLPKRIYEDCLKEEPEMVAAAGGYFGKLCGASAMKLARDIVMSEK